MSVQHIKRECGCGCGNKVDIHPRMFNSQPEAVLWFKSGHDPRFDSHGITFQSGGGDGILMAVIKQHEGLNRHERRMLNSRKFINKQIEDQEDDFEGEVEHVHPNND